MNTPVHKGWFCRYCVCTRHSFYFFQVNSSDTVRRDARAPRRRSVTQENARAADSLFRQKRGSYSDSDSDMDLLRLWRAFTLIYLPFLCSAIDFKTRTGPQVTDKVRRASCSISANTRATRREASWSITARTAKPSFIHTHRHTHTHTHTQTLNLRCMLVF